MALKRKPSIHGVCIDPKKKVVSGAPSIKATKVDLIQEVKSLKSLNDTLKEEMKRNTEINKIFKTQLLCYQLMFVQRI